MSDIRAALGGSKSDFTKIQPLREARTEEGDLSRSVFSDEPPIATQSIGDHLWISTTVATPTGSVNPSVVCICPCCNMGKGRVERTYKRKLSSTPDTDVAIEVLSKNVPAAWAMPSKIAHI